ncbi:MAG TPA: PilZ domain-containing protein [Thermodesulfobacteriota bacterium]|nr:PilZ domain-containing protein [Thermodesulfobacteriota bacterium]
MTERRNEERHVVPEMYREYFTFKARAGSNEFVSLKLLDFSGHGIRMKSSRGLSVDSNVECLIAAPKSFSKEILFVGRIKYCIQDESEGDYLIGAEVVETDDPIGFELFSKVHHFIKERIGEIF